MNILFPIETIAREIDFKLYLAVMLTKNNKQILIAQHNLIDEIVSVTKDGIYFGKNIFKDDFLGPNNESNLNYYNKLKDQNYTLIHLDEEGGIYPGDENNWNAIIDRRLMPDKLHDDDFVFTWGKYQQERYNSQLTKEQKAKILCTGHPKFDLYKPNYRELYKKEIDSINDKFGNFILINTNLALANNSLGIEDTFSPRLGYSKEDKDRRMEYIEEWAIYNRIFTNFIQLIHRLAHTFPDKKFVLRPHPAEDPEYYKIAFKWVDNIIVNSEGSVGPWLMASDLMIHDGCTTAVEAYLSHVPVINYKSLLEDKYNIVLPNQIGIKCYKEEEVIETINDILENREQFLQKNSFSEDEYKLIENLNDDVLDDIISKLDSIIEEKKKVANKSLYSNSKLLMKEIIYKYISKLKLYIKFLFFPKKYKEQKGYERAFPGFDKKSIASKIEAIEKITNIKVSYKLIGDRVIVINSTQL
jgi:surface carbohydrate biosynthesis protein